MFSMATPMLPVTSTRSTTSGFGGISGVVTILSTLAYEPGSAGLLTEAGETPGSARAVPTRPKARAVVTEKRIAEGSMEAWNRGVAGMRRTREAGLAVLNKHEGRLRERDDGSGVPSPLVLCLTSAPLRRSAGWPFS